MQCIWKHIDWLDFDNIVSIFKEIEITGECDRVTGDIDDSSRFDFLNCGDEFFGGSASRRIHDDDIEMIFGGEHVFGTIPFEESSVGNLIDLGVRNGIVNSVFDNLHTDDILAVRSA